MEVQVLSLSFMLWSLSGGASAPKADSPKGYVGSNPIHSVLGFGVTVSQLTLNQQMGVRFSQSQLYVRVAKRIRQQFPKL